MVKKDVPILVSKDSSKPNLFVMGVSGKGMCFNNKLVLMKNEDRYITTKIVLESITKGSVNHDN